MFAKVFFKKKKEAKSLSVHEHDMFGFTCALFPVRSPYSVSKETPKDKFLSTRLQILQ
jgi:hypothetical protein